MNPERYARQLALSEVGIEGQQRLQQASMLVVGAGGLACPVLQYLAGAGVGHIHVIDGDRIELSNLHRQPLYGTDDIGQPKVRAAAAAVRRMNPQVRITTDFAWLTPANATTLVEQATVVIDAGDNRGVTYMLSDACVALNKPLISASALGFEGHVGAFCGGWPSYRALMPDMPQAAANCSTSGVIGTVVAILGALEAHFALQIILKISPLPLGRLIRFDAMRMRFSELDFSQASEPSGPQLHFIAADAVKADDFIVDLRGQDEARPEDCLPGAQRILPEDIEVLHDHVAMRGRIILCCRSGLRAWWAARRLQHMGAHEVSLVAMGDRAMPR